MAESSIDVSYSRWTGGTTKGSGGSVANAGPASYGVALTDTELGELSDGFEGAWERREWRYDELNGRGP